jgi:hypothetical protein
VTRIDVNAIGDGRDRVEVAWENGRTLSLVMPPDRVRVVKDC